MNNNEIEKRLASAFEAAAPDMLDSLMSEIESAGRQEPQLRERLAEDSNNRFEGVKLRSRRLRAVISAAAALVIMAGAAAVWNNINYAVAAVVDIDVNPSIELSINGKEKVISAVPVNEDGEAILSDMDLKGSDVRVACNAIVGSMLTRGYLNEQSNSILLSVSAKDSAKGRQIEEQLSGHINDYMDNASIAAAILGQYVDNDDELSEFAARNGISTGKALLIRKLLDTGSTRMTEESLLKLSTQDLIMLSQERSVKSDTSYGKADTGRYIGRDRALAAALKHAGLTEESVSGTGVEMDCENGIIIYEVEFRSGAHEYEYDINASDGSVISSDAETVKSGSGGSSAAYDDVDNDADDDADDRDDAYDDDDDSDSDDDD